MLFLEVIIINYEVFFYRFFLGSPKEYVRKKEPYCSLPKGQEGQQSSWFPSLQAVRGSPATPAETGFSVDLCTPVLWGLAFTSHSDKGASRHHRQEEYPTLADNVMSPASPTWPRIVSPPPLLCRLGKQTHRIRTSRGTQPSGHRTALFTSSHSFIFS